MSVISALKRLRQEDPEFKANMGYLVRFSLKKTKKQKGIECVPN
jgi:hypothetical protein